VTFEKEYYNAQQVKVDGWIVYGVEVMLDVGFLDGELRMVDGDGSLED